VRRLVIATKNLGKAREMAEALSDLSYEVVSLADYPDAPEVEETGSTFIANAILKATEYARFTGELTLADDSGLEVDALSGAPGVFSSRFAPTDPERNAKLLTLMEDVPDEKRTARFRCAIAIAESDGEVETCEGAVEGVIAREPKGTNGFGYDPVFYVLKLGRHMAELTSAEKNAISHRGKALEKTKGMLLGCPR
jgi:XTP/dITP diphosphohydrolase